MKTNYEFSRNRNADRINVGHPREETLTANAEECAALAKRFGLLALDRLEAAITITRLPDDPGVLAVEGHISADVTQACVATLEPVPETVVESFETLVSSQAYIDKFLEEHPEEELDAPEPLDNGHVDLGEVVAQYLALALNPYPRREGVEFLGNDAEAESEAAERHNPFAVLSVLKDKKK